MFQSVNYENSTEYPTMQFSTLLVTALLSLSVSAAPIGDIKALYTTVEAPAATETFSATSTATTIVLSTSTVQLVQNENSEEIVKPSYLVNTDNIQGSTRLSKREALENLANYLRR
ncbi:hypothetical protein WICPIJ_000872 [Wickerhamomyces pijperi]|uniref:Uncharacterized protein n=1 Tax=Wickerhamomyces pijperi TaxID=599730 RepID=A0A9P8TRX7_WICPI|nr:hypothetical protein WICPIJ_000872 [Wickerhamomyces pijperi]